MSSPRPDGSVRLGYRSPLDVDALFAFVAARAIPGVEAVDGVEYRRVVRPAGGDGMLRLRPSADGAMELEVEGAGRNEVAGFVGVARRLLDLDADPATIDGVLAADDVLRPLVRAHSGMRLPGAFDGFAATVLAILAQGVTLVSSRTLAGRIAQAHGRVVDVGDPAINRVFPEPGVLVRADLGALGLTGRRAATIRAVAAAVAEGRLSLDGDADPGRALATLGAISGIGPWTLGYVALRVFAERDAFPPGDAAVRAAFRRLGLPSDPASIAVRAEAWRPWRGYALAHLWASD